MPTPQVLDDPSEQERLKAHDPKLLLRSSRWVGDEVIANTFSINDKRERELLIQFADEMDTIDDGSNAEKLRKGVPVEAVADQIYGSRDSYYVGRIRLFMSYDGKINRELKNGAMVDVQDGQVIKTRAIDDFEEFARQKVDKTIKTTVKAATQNIGQLNDFLALLERRNPEVKEITAAERGRAFDDLSAQVPSRIRALAPSKRSR